MPTFIEIPCQKDIEKDFFKTRQSMFVKRVPPLWAYFIEATK